MPASSIKKQVNKHHKKKMQREQKHLKASTPLDPARQVERVLILLKALDIVEYQDQMS